MIHKLDIHSGGNNVVTEDLSGSAIARTLQKLSCSVVSHVSSVACGVTIDKCCLTFRVLSRCHFHRPFPLSCVCGRLNLNNRFMQLLPDSSPVLLGCNCLRTDSLKAFRINPMGNQASRKLLQSRARSFARLVAGAQVPEACSTLSRTDLEDPLNVSDDGKTFTCAITGWQTAVCVCEHLCSGHSVILCFPYQGIVPCSGNCETSVQRRR